MNLKPITQRGLPPLFPGPAGRESWEQRRADILNLFRSEVFGRSPTDFSSRFSLLAEETLPGGCVRRVQAEIFAPRGKHSFVFSLYLPARKEPVPAFILICGTEPQELAEKRPGFLPVHRLLERGYACAAFCSRGLDTDADDGFHNGIASVFEPNLSARPGDRWGTIAMWAFGASRVADYLCAQKEINPRRISVIGHSRGGKTALWCGVNDPRIACAFSNDSGCTGAALTRGNTGEQIADINRVFPYWFCKNYQKYNSCPESLPVDAHMLLALMAPRLVYVASASDDDWADPGSEFLGAVACSEVWERAYELPGLAVREHPGIEAPVHSGHVGYHMHRGGHGLTAYDWECYMDFLDLKTPLVLP